MQGRQADARKIVFGLFNGKIFHPSATMTFNDINFGVPAFITMVECVIFSFVFLWAFSATEYKEGQRMDRYGMGPAQRTRTWRAILNALNLSDIIIGTVVAFQLLFMSVGSRYGYGASSVPQGKRDMGTDDQHLEPLSDQSRMRGYSGGSDFNTEYSPPLETGGYGAPPPDMPRAAQDPSSADRAKTFRADDLRPSVYGGGQGEYEPLTRSREQSPSGQGAHYPRQMV